MNRFYNLDELNQVPGSPPSLPSLQLVGAELQMRKLPADEKNLFSGLFEDAFADAQGQELPRDRKYGKRHYARAERALSRLARTHFKTGMQALDPKQFVNIIQNPGVFYSVAARHPVFADNMRKYLTDFTVLTEPALLPASREPPARGLAARESVFDSDLAGVVSRLQDS